MTKKNRKYLSNNDNNNAFYDKYAEITQKIASIEEKEKGIGRIKEEEITKIRELFFKYSFYLRFILTDTGNKLFN